MFRTIGIMKMHLLQNMGPKIEQAADSMTCVCVSVCGAGRGGSPTPAGGSA